MRESVLWFGDKMEHKLLANDRKPGWEDLSDVYLLKRLHEEITELEAALGDTSAEAIILECADVANFAMMLADKRRPGPHHRGISENSISKGV